MLLRRGTLIDTHTPMTPKRWFVVAYGCSGLAGLIYQVTWTRLLMLHMGHTLAAVTTVVAAFMGGLAVGACWVAGSRAHSAAVEPCTPTRRWKRLPQ